MPPLLDRKEAAARVAAVLRFSYCDECNVAVVPHLHLNGHPHQQSDVRLIPQSFDPMGDHLAFVGRMLDDRCYKFNIAWEVGLGAVIWVNDVRADAPDPSWAAMIAILRVKKQDV